MTLALTAAGPVFGDSLDQWSVRASGVSENHYGAANGAGTFVVLGWNGKILVATNPASWAPATSGITSTLLSVARGSDCFVAVGRKSLILQSGPVSRLDAAGADAGGGHQWLLTGERGRDYRFQYSDDPGQGDWIYLMSFTSAGETTLLSDPFQSNSAARLYRVVSP